MFKLLAMTGLVMLAATLGCATSTYRQGSHWSRPGMTDPYPLSLQADQDTCRMQAEQEFPALDDGSHLEARRNAIFRCMEEKGWSWQAEPVRMAPQRGGYRY
jgi:hypothetical protein